MLSVINHSPGHFPFEDVWDEFIEFHKCRLVHAYLPFRKEKLSDNFFSSYYIRLALSSLNLSKENFFQ